VEHPSTRRLSSDSALAAPAESRLADRWRHFAGVFFFEIYSNGLK
jgi:hypothetical protein